MNNMNLEVFIMRLCRITAQEKIFCTTRESLSVVKGLNLVDFPENRYEFHE